MAVRYAAGRYPVPKAIFDKVMAIEQEELATWDPPESMTDPYDGSPMQTRDERKKVKWWVRREEAYRRYRERRGRGMPKIPRIPDPPPVQATAARLGGTQERLPMNFLENPTPDPNEDPP